MLQSRARIPQCQCHCPSRRRSARSSRLRCQVILHQRWLIRPAPSESCWIATLPLPWYSQWAQQTNGSDVRQAVEGTAESTARFLVRSWAVPFGEHLRVVGSGTALGDWDPAGGVTLQWSEGNDWRGEASLPCGTATFKVGTAPRSFCRRCRRQQASVAVHHTKPLC